MGRAARLALVDRFVEIEVAELLSFLVVSVQAAGGVPNKEASTCKMYGTEALQRLAATKMRTLGTRSLLFQPGGLEARHTINAPIDYLAIVSATIAGGTSEIQRNIIATRGLGLPRA